MAEATECAICIEKFNGSRRKRLLCPYCPTDGTEMPYCITCAKAYLLQDDAHSPRCAACRGGWTEDFLTQTFAKTWLLKEYKAHREHILLDVERARLPEAQEDAARYRKAKQVADEFAKQITPIKEEMKQLPEVQREKDAYRLYTDAVSARRNSERQAVNQQIQPQSELRNQETLMWQNSLTASNNLRQARQPFKRRLEAIYNNPDYQSAAVLMTTIGVARAVAVAGAGAGASTEAAKSRWTFVMKCPLEACEGFVGTNWKCGLCEAEFCKECGDRTTAEEHTCNPDTLSTFKALRKEAKPCPKCAAMISKIDGCDQMWCTQCQTAFSWRTGQIEVSHVHNPHYFEWMRKNGGAPAPPRIAAGDCLNLTPGEMTEQVFWNLRQLMQRSLLQGTPQRDNILGLMMEWVRNIRHNMQEQRWYQTQLREKQNDEWRRQLRVKRLVNEITDDVWKDRLQRGEKAAQKIYAVLQVLDLYIQAGVDLLRETLPETADIQNIANQLEALRTFCNGEMLKIQKRYNSDVVYLKNPANN